MSDSVSVGPGTVLADRYKLTKLIGRGGFGEVYEATQLNMDRVVAVKILPAEFMSVYDVVARFKREAKLASRLRHPNTITLHDYGQHGESLFIVMELLEGEDLADLLRVEGKLPLERIFHIATGILKSLSEAHEHGIVHRDLKPENIFLSTVGDDTDHIKVLDFGIAKLALPELKGHPDPERKLTLAGSTVGTPAYMSPEQAAGEEVDGQSDLYALGIMMYEMANGRAPFHHKDLVKIMRAHLFEPVPRLRDVNLHNTLFEKVVMKALEKEREKRFRSASEFLLAIAGGPVVQPLIYGLPLPADMPRKFRENSDKMPLFVIPDEDRTRSSSSTKPSDTSSIIQIIHPLNDEESGAGLEANSEPVILLTKKKKKAVESTEMQISDEKEANFDDEIFHEEATSKSPQEWAFDEERNDQIKKQPVWVIFVIFIFAILITAWFTRGLWS